MIVVDTNVVACLYLRNVLAGYLRRGVLTFDQARGALPACATALSRPA